MNIKKIPRYIARCWALGARESFALMRDRVQTAYFERRSRYRAAQRRAHISWYDLHEQYKLPATATMFVQHVVRQQQLPRLAQHEVLSKVSATHCFDLLGSGDQCFDQVPWHTDIRLRAQRPQADHTWSATMYYKDISITAGRTSQLEKDIKLPWELSRFQHLYALGLAYEQSHDECYATAFCVQITDWIEKNNYLLGPNWVCPMDVALRALNWIIALPFFADCSFDEQCWQRLVCSLYDHLVYLEHNWEVYDGRTSNHYLSDLVGYLYLCYFFSSIPAMQQKLQWCFQQLEQEMVKQVLPDGTDYEGSTYYHKLVTELFYHVHLLAPYARYRLSVSFTTKLQQMMAFLAWCTPYKGELVQIGDNDAGKVTVGLSEKVIRQFVAQEKEGLHYVPNFGLSIIKTNTWHVTVRHHAYNKRQPSGHFHNDVGSITVVLHGIPVIVDPGSFVYTPSALWRNHFRSVQVHNTFYVDGQEPVPLDDRLFALGLPESDIKHTQGDEQHYQINTYHDLYVRFGLRAQRVVQLQEQDNTLVIRDSWQQHASYTQEDLLHSCWNLTFHPAIHISQQDNLFLLQYERKTIAHLIATMPLIIQDGIYSPSYGVKQDCLRLTGTMPLTWQEQAIRITVV